MPKTFSVLLKSLLLFFLGCFLSISFFFNSDINPNILPHNELKNNIVKDNDAIVGRFKASDNYLGIVSVRLEKKNFSNEDSIFRIKNTKDNFWYHTATISASQYNTIPFYSFGFPIIKNSKNKTYQFEIRLPSGNKELALSKEEPIVISNYIYPKTVLLGNSKLLSHFAKNKVSYYLHNKNSQGVLIVYSLPLILYLLYIFILSRFILEKNMFPIKKIFKILNKPIIIIPILGMLADIFIIRKYSDSTTLILISFWIIAIISHRLETEFSFGIAMIFLIFCPFLLTAKMEWIAEKSAVWAYMLLVVGTIQSLFEISPVLQKIIKTKLIKNIIEPIRSVFLFFDKLTISLINYFKKTFVSYTILIFRQMPKTFFDWVIVIIKLIILIISLMVISWIYFFTIHKVYNRIQIIRHDKYRSSLNPIIEIVEPRLVYKGTKIVIYGKGFGWNSKKTKVLIDGKKINSTLLDESKIIFIVPLDWKKGLHKIWVEKQIMWDRKKEIAKSGVFEIKVLPINDELTPDDNLYFEQLKKLKKETLRLNGYN